MSDQQKQQYPESQVRFVQAIQDMRDAQKDYFNQPNQHRLKIAVRKELTVDSLLQPYIKAGIIKPKERIVTPNNDLFTKQP